ncbi:hypothetical protein BP6252_03744 [Coleophoma cylindrospora]|uniref:Uncharacterized protein n=1 Tax=Coleophoma cylindrospora TaxID=1849047 RepID=A0A3D8S8G4_9HELO|nr:hypothetical protein BP6252_03744 [Coleophoma cylindrospora]
MPAVGLHNGSLDWIVCVLLALFFHPGEDREDAVQASAYLTAARSSSLVGPAASSEKAQGNPLAARGRACSEEAVELRPGQKSSDKRV